MGSKETSKTTIILLVEDDEGHAKLITRALEGVEVPKKIFWVADGEAALDFLFHHRKYEDKDKSPRPDLIILDLRLPKRDGQEVLKKIKNSAKLKSIPVVVITSSQNKEDEAQAYANYANSYLLKPSDFHEFSGMIQEAGSYWLIWNQRENVGM